MIFSDVLKDLMIEKGLTQAQVAKAVGVSQRAVSKWVNKQSEPTATNIYNLAVFFGVTSDFLIGLEKD